MFSDVIVLHGQNNSPATSSSNLLSTNTNIDKKNVCSSEKTTQAGDGNIWQITSVANQQQLLQTQQQIQQDCNDLMNGEALTCQELLALGAINAALPTGQIVLDTFFNSLSKGIGNRQKNSEELYIQQLPEDDYTCCQDMWHCESEYKNEKRSKFYIFCCLVMKGIVKLLKALRRYCAHPSNTCFHIHFNSILGMYLFGGKFCTYTDENGVTKDCDCEMMNDKRCLCDRKHFNNILWATVTVFQILTQEDWNMVLSNGMAKTSNWAALYFVALMTFGNYVLFNLLVAILVEGFSSERNERREREQRELARRKMSCILEASLRGSPGNSSQSMSSSTDSYTQPSPPIITHTAATPQDSPSTTLDDFPEFRYNVTTITNDNPIASDSSPGCPSSADSTTQKTSFERPPDEPNQPSGKIVIHNEKVGSKTMTFSEKVTQVPNKNDTKQNHDKNKIQRKCSWKLASRPSLRRKKNRSGSDSEAVPLNNGRDHSQCNGGGVTRHASLRSDSLLQSSIRIQNDTQKDTPNNKSAKGLSPQNSIRCRSNTFSTVPPQAPAAPALTRKNSLNRSPVLQTKSNKSGSPIESRKNSHIELKSVNSLNDKSVTERSLPQIKLEECVPRFSPRLSVFNRLEMIFEPTGCLKEKDDYSLYLFSPKNRFRKHCRWLVKQNWFDNLVLFFIALNCITLAMERPNIPPDSTEKLFLQSCNYIFSVVFATEMFVKLFKGTFYYCSGENLTGIITRQDCANHGYEWKNQKYNFDDLVQALMSLFVLSSRDGWVNIMYTGLDAVGVDKQPIVNYSEWRLLYFISFILLVGFFVLNMFVGVVVENFHRCREEQEKEERIRKAAKRALQMEKRRRNIIPEMNEPPYYINYAPWRLDIHKIVTSKYFDLAIALVIGLNVITMATERYKMPEYWEYALRIFNYFFTAVFILESTMKLIALGFKMYMKDKWNLLDVAIVILSVVGIIIEEIVQDLKIIPINPTIIRVLRVMRIARVLKLLKMAKGIRALLDTVMQALPQVGNLGLLFFLLFFIFAALGVELFGRLDCNITPCQGLGEHAHFENFGMAFLTLFRVATGDNWNGIMKDTLDDENCNPKDDCIRNCCISPIIAPIFFVIFVLMAQFVLVNVVVAVLMKHLEESHKHLEDEQDMDAQLEREFAEKQEINERRELCLALQLDQECQRQQKPLTKKTTKKNHRKIAQTNLDEIVTISPQTETMKPPKNEEPRIKKVNETNESNKLLLVPLETKPLHRLYGSTKHLFQKQKSMDISEETPFLLTVPGTQQGGEPKIPKHDSQESVQRIIKERRKLDEHFKDINQYDIFDVTRNSSEENLVDKDEQREGSDVKSNDKHDTR
ncbi:hypothetical protein NQ314_000610, partial [Rhamnusium bicolor]